ncbi:MAG: polysaccharide biosynthesis/export family protein [Planctomycetia bacterium]
MLRRFFLVSLSAALAGGCAAVDQQSAPSASFLRPSMMRTDASGESEVKIAKKPAASLRSPTAAVSDSGQAVVLRMAHTGHAPRDEDVTLLPSTAGGDLAATIPIVGAPLGRQTGSADTGVVPVGAKKRFLMEAALASEFGGGAAVAPACASCGGHGCKRCGGHAMHHKQKHRKPSDRPSMADNPNLPRELRMASHPQYVVEPPDVLYIQASNLLPQRPIDGERLIRQDGTISLGYYGQVHVANLTIAEIEEKLKDHLKKYVKEPIIYVDVAAFNSKVYYVLGQVLQTGRLPITGKETVLDAIVLAGGLTNFANMRQIHVARPNPGGGCDQILPVDYLAITSCGDTRTNYQLLPGDRVMVPRTAGYVATVFLENFLTPVERVISAFSIFRFAVLDNNNQN